MKDIKVLITGGTGSLGRALVKKIKQFGWQIIIFSRDEGKQALYYGHDKNIIRVIGDIRDLGKLEKICKLHKPNYIIHAAALKRIDDLEIYPDECIKTNILGSENVAIAASNSNVEKCILISTDKACMPINVYGSSKFIAERIFTNYDYNSLGTIFASVRYGNVIASRGSFVPLWLKQIEKNNKITVTSLECSRFLFTLENATDAVINALLLSQGGEVFIPKISSFNMTSVIEAVKKTYSVENFECEIIGLRPGEKIHEDMLALTELPLTREANDNLLVVLPQYSKRKHVYKKKYKGPCLNSALCLNNDVDYLCDLMKSGDYS